MRLEFGFKNIFLHFVHGMDWEVRSCPQVKPKTERDPIFAIELTTNDNGIVG